MACQRCGGYHLSIEPCEPWPQVTDLTDPYGEKLIEEFEKDFEEGKDDRHQ